MICVFKIIGLLCKYPTTPISGFGSSDEREAARPKGSFTPYYLGLHPSLSIMVLACFHDISSSKYLALTSLMPSRQLARPLSIILQYNDMSNLHCLMDLLRKRLYMAHICTEVDSLLARDIVLWPKCYNDYPSLHISFKNIDRRREAKRRTA